MLLADQVVQPSNSSRNPLADKALGKSYLPAVAVHFIDYSVAGSRQSTEEEQQGNLPKLCRGSSFKEAESELVAAASVASTAARAQLGVARPFRADCSILSSLTPDYQNEVEEDAEVGQMDTSA